MAIRLITLLLTLNVTHLFAFNTNPIQRRLITTKQPKSSLSMSYHDIIITNSHWIDYAIQGLADTSATICPNFGEKGWAPFCFLNGNPVFNAFDSYQLFIQNSVVSLHDLLKVRV